MNVMSAMNWRLIPQRIKKIPAIILLLTVMGPFSAWGQEDKGSLFGIFCPSRKGQMSSSATSKDEEYDSETEEERKEDVKLQGKFAHVIRPFWKKGVEGRFTGVGGAELAYLKFRHPEEKGSLVIVSGRGNHREQFKELAYDFYKNGYSLYIYDHRGHGYSQRLTDNPEVIHVDSFEDYVEDLKTLIDSVVKKETDSKVFLFGHSMGGAISALYLANHPGAVDGAVLSAPMMEINTGGVPPWLAKFISQVMGLVGYGKQLAISQEGYRPRFHLKDTSTHCRARLNRLLEDAWENPKLRHGGSSFNWVAEGLKATEKIQEKAFQIKVPIVLFQAEEDSYVLPGGQDQFCQKAPNCKKIVLKGSRHCPWGEKDKIRRKMMRKTLQFLNSFSVMK